MSSVLDRRRPLGGRTPDRTVPRASPRSVGDPLIVALVALVALVVYALHGTRGIVNRDLGVFLYGGEHVAHGIPPYVGIFNSVGPLADAVPGLAIWVGARVGLDPVTSARLLFLLISVGCVVLTYVLTRDAFRSRSAGLVAAAVFLVFPKFLDFASGGPREKTTMVLALLGCVVLLQRRRYFGAGVCAALATLTWQPALAPAVAAALAAGFLVGRTGRGRAAVAFVVGGLLPTALAVVWFAATGSLGPALGGFLLINLFDTRQPSPLLSPGPTGGLLWHAYGPSLLLVPLGVVSLVVLAVRSRGPRICAAAAVGATAWSLAVLNGGPDLFVVLPFAAAGVAGLAVALTQRLPRSAAYGVLATLTAAFVMVAGVVSVATRSDRLDVQEADVARVLATEPGTAQVLSIDAPEVLALSGRSNPTPYQLFTANMQRYLDANLPGGIAGYARDVAALQPTFVVVGTSYRGTWPDLTLAKDYWRVGRGPGWTWYLDREAGLGALDRARAANLAAVRSAVVARPPA